MQKIGMAGSKIGPSKLFAIRFSRKIRRTTKWFRSGFFKYTSATLTLRTD